MKHISVWLAFLFGFLLIPMLLSGCGQSVSFPEVPDYSKEELSSGEVRMNVYRGAGYLRWAETRNATEYKIYSSKSRYGDYTEVATVSGTSYTVTSDYYDYFKVTAVVNGREIDVGSPVSAFTNTLVVGPDDDMSEVQSRINMLHGALESFDNGQFSDLRNAIVFLPGEYPELDVKVGYYTSVNGVGKTPYDVSVGSIYVSDNILPGGNATCTFWRSIENLTIDSDTIWAVSQATSLRRISVNGDLALSYSTDTSWSSGGFLANSEVTGTVDPGTQQQWFTRNSEWSDWTHCSSISYVFTGCEGPIPTGAWTESGVRSTVFSTTEKMAEKPFLTYDDKLGYGVFVPNVEENTAGVTWKQDNESGTFIPLDEFYIANEKTDTAASLNAALAAGYNLFFPAGNYLLEKPLEITRENTVVLGMGYATLKISDSNKKSAINIADIGGVRVADILIDAGNKSKNMIVVGKANSKTSHADNPVVLSNIYIRIGGAENVHTETDTAMVIYANDTIGDNFWIWRADHSYGTAWEDTKEDGWISYGNPIKTGLLVEGDNVSCYALMVEHTEGYQTDWKGENGLTVMYQSETPYVVPSQSKWMSPHKKNGMASYHVGDKVQNHRAYGIGVYLVNYGEVNLESAIEAPENPGIVMEHLVTCNFTMGNPSTISHVINDIGGEVGPYNFRSLVSRFVPSGAVKPDYDATSADIEADGDSVYFTVSGTYKGDADAIKSYLDTIYYDFQQNQQAGASGWDRISGLPVMVNVSGGEWSIKFDVTSLSDRAYVVHFDSTDGVGGDESNTVDLKLTAEVNGKTATVGTKTYTLVSIPESSQGSDFWGAVGIRITE